MKEKPHSTLDAEEEVGLTDDRADFAAFHRQLGKTMRYLRAQTLDEVHAALRESARAQILGGGTDLLVQMKSRRADPDCIIDIKHLKGMRDISCNETASVVGASVSGAELGENDAFARLWPGVTEAAQLIGSTQIQGRATLVGNLCNASPAADTIPALIAAGAVAQIAGGGGTRELDVADLPTGPGSNALAADEFVTGLHLPARGKGMADAYLRFIPRTEMDIAVASAGVNLTVSGDGTVTAARVALGAVAPVPFLCEAAGEALVGTRADDDTLARLKVICAEAARPISDKRGTVEFRRTVVGVLASRAARIAYDRARGTA